MLATGSAPIAQAGDKQLRLGEAGLGGELQPRVSGGQESGQRARGFVSMAGGEGGGLSA